MKLKQIKSNMAELTLNNGDIILFSYETPVAARVNGVYYRTSYKWSATTTRHINYWLNGVESFEKDQSFFDELVD